MPWKPDSVGSRRTGRWQRLSQQTRRGEPLCRLCLSAGKVEPATVVDHIVPLAEGGTHATDNLMPLCKRCHDTIKTPADNTRMAKVIPCVLRLVWPSLRSAIPCTVNAVELRFSLCSKMPIGEAQAIAAAAVEGVVKASQRGDLKSASVSVVVDDSRLAKHLVACYGVELEDIATHDDTPEATGQHARWIESRRSTERAMRSGCAQGDQPPVT